ncbi:MAG: L-glutamyl-[BtrI acyl-carrier protein] decarboxylase [Promethearchaeota archaeon]|nr:MAG: L-glutamyl-[BtrI acyl-carrier protein] decarboxylase [Candidatus Lokiarchaeota archaeon]
MKTLAGNPYIKIKEDKVFIDLVPLKQVLSNYDTPLMIFIENRIRENIHRFNEVFNAVFKQFEGFYSVKANYLSAINGIISQENIGAEIISLPELKTAIQSGFSPSNCIVGGPYLSNALLTHSIELGVKEIVVYSIEDLLLVNEYATKQNVVQEICLRINSMKYDSKLGIKIDEDNCKQLKNIITHCKNIQIVSILSHYGSQMNNPDQYFKNACALINAIKRLEDFEIKIKNINFGGGFPEATVMPIHQLKKIATGIKDRLLQHEITYERIYFEPGRYIVGDTALFIASVIKKTSDRWIFINIGNHICPKFAKCAFRFYNASHIEKAHKYKTSIAGIIPTDQDVLAKDYFFTEEIEVGDQIIVTNVGAYCLTFSNRFPYALPKIILVEGKNYREIFDQHTDKDFSIY